jgi:hypothetical protein
LFPSGISYKFINKFLKFFNCYWLIVSPYSVWLIVELTAVGQVLGIALAEVNRFLWYKTFIQSYTSTEFNNMENRNNVENKF